ncbi:hypothetical protein LO771_27880 [Streptacidiphilus sp. ASG 303]|uniref:hypothetical protein n=1 Tax=Streptacidiphilus sp. ASG 303 TaxID=2896847 RepID=UPI001E38470C|nr:hypothetical protein [Streptacidiphilus sp. ASG 303]MCD0486098.1 hypothetical protein [Streptacidiphilus sp. ASG 303]
MPILDVLTEVAKTGRLGPVFVGARLDDVAAVAGEPLEIGSMDRLGTWPRLLAYGDLELSVCRCSRINIICIQTWRDDIDLPSSIVGGTGMFPAAISYADVVSALDSGGCPWQPNPSLTFDSQRTLTATPSAMDFAFELLPDGEFVLNVVSLPGDGHDCSDLNPKQGRRSEGRQAP